MKKQSNGTWWKVLIILTFIISVSSLFINILNKPEIIEEVINYEYKTKIIELNNSNTIERFDFGVEIIDYLCDEGVRASVFSDKLQFYASTWEGTDGIDKGFTGKCMIKIRKKI